MPYLIQSNGVTETREPKEGRWYAGVNELGQVGALAKYACGRFSNSECDDYDMSKYHLIRELLERSK